VTEIDEKALCKEHPRVATDYTNLARLLWDQGKYAEAEPPLRQYDIEVGGTVGESAKSQASVLAVVPAMLFITVTLLIIQLQSFSRMFLVLSVVPIGPDWRRRRVAHFA